MQAAPDQCWLELVKDGKMDRWAIDGHFVRQKEFCDNPLYDMVRIVVFKTSFDLVTIRIWHVKI